MKHAAQFLVIALLSLTPSLADARQQAEADRIFMILNPGPAQRQLYASSPDQRLALGRGDVLLVLYPDDRTAQYAGPFSGTLAQARSREVASQGIWNRMFSYLRQTRDSLRRAGTRTEPTTPSSVPWIARRSISDLDQLPPISVRGQGPQCVTRGQRPQLWRDAFGLEQTFSLVVGDQTTVVTFPAGEAVIEWPVDRPERLSGQAVTATPSRIYGPQTFTLVAVENASGPAMLSGLSEAGCDQQAQAVMDYLWRSATELPGG